MNPYEVFLSVFNCKTYHEMYSLLKLTAESKLGLDGVPFPLSELEHPPGNWECPEIKAFITQCYNAASGDTTDDEVINLIKFLKDNHPIESYKNPELSNVDVTVNEDKLMTHIFYFGVDLPGSKH